jgi:FixJ family two-component response regulator
MSTKRNVVAIIDDNLGILGAMGRLLSALGYDTELYASAKEFIDAAMMTEAICLIVDVQLGESCGIEFAQHLANAGFRIPIIFMSARNNESVKRRAMEIGCVAFLTKPFSADVLIEALANAGRDHAGGTRRLLVRCADWSSSDAAGVQGICKRLETSETNSRDQT